MKKYFSQLLQVRWIALICCIFFTGAAFVQYLYIYHSDEGALHRQLQSDANDLLHQINYTGNWAETNWQDVTPNEGYDLITNAGFIDFEYFGYNIPIHAAWTDINVPPNTFQTITKAGASWCTYRENLKDGNLLFDEDGTCTNDLEHKILQSLAGFGSTIASALSEKTYYTNINLNYAVLDGYGDVKMVAGDLPLTVGLPSTTLLLERPDTTHVVLYQPILNQNGTIGGMLIIPYDRSILAQTLNYEFWFIIAVAILSWLFFFGYGFYIWLSGEAKVEALKRMFSGYFSPQIMGLIQKNPDSLQLSGQRKEIAILFSDIRSFTTLSENLPPKILTEFLHEYFNAMTEEILKTDGVVDKFIGDGIMAFWGAPVDQIDKDDRAVITSRNMISRLHELNADWKARDWPQIDVGIGIHTGVAVVGNVGSETRFDYSAVGDVVNTASRLESLNKEFKTNIIISEATRRNLTIDVDLKDLGETKVRGREESVRIYQIKTA